MIKTPIILTSAGFAAFVVWLLAIAMDGPLPGAIGVPGAADYFLPAHIGSLLLIGLFCPRRFFGTLLLTGGVLSVLLSISIGFSDPVFAPYMLAAVGVTSSPIAIGACLLLRRNSSPLYAALIGLAVGNILFVPVSLWPEPGLLAFAAVSMPLIAIPALYIRLPADTEGTGAASLWRFLPFIFLFQIVSGLMYAFMMPAYAGFAYVPGSELVFYIAGAAASRRIASANPDLAMVCGVVLGMVAFTTLQAGDFPISLNTGMFTMMAAAGFIDMVLLVIILSSPDPQKAAGTGLAVLCGGILAGKFTVRYFATAAGSIALTGNLVLNISIVTLYFLGRQHFAFHENPSGRGDSGEPVSNGSSKSLAATITPDMVQPASAAAGKTASGSVSESFPTSLPQMANAMEHLPEHLRLLLSEREYHVLGRALAGSTYRETAAELGISESTVKTYMYRIYEKMGVKGKKQLFEKLSHFRQAL